MSAQQELDLARRQADYYGAAERHAFVDGAAEVARYYRAQHERFAARAATLSETREVRVPGAPPHVVNVVTDRASGQVLSLTVSA